MRDTQLDAYRALIMMYIVCFIHTVCWFGLFSDTFKSIILFEMPVIFFISGAAQSLRKKEESLSDILRNRTKRILLPYYIYLIIMLAWMLVIACLHPNTGDIIIDIRLLTARDYLKMFLTGGSEKIPYYGYTWFIWVYLAISCSLYFQRKILKKIPAPLYILIWAAIVVTLSHINFSGELEIKNIPLYNIFFISGFTYYKKYNKNNLYAIAFLTSLICIWGFVQGFMVPMQDHKFPCDYIFLVFGTAALSILCIILRKIKIPYPYILRIWNQRGYTIYLYQTITSCTLYCITYRWIEFLNNDIIKMLVYVLLSFAITTAASYVTYPFEKWIIRKISFH